MTPNDCLVCVKHRAADPTLTIARSPRVYVGHHPLGPTAYRGHLFVEPLRHVRGWGELDDDETAELGVTIGHVTRALGTIGAEHDYLAVFGDGVPHLHVHLLPRWPGTPRDYWGLHVNDWADAPRIDGDSLAKTVDALRGALAL